jgi:hypothetical protein
MIRECFKSKSGILFLVHHLKTVNLDPDALDPDALYPVKTRPELPLIELLPPEDRYIKPMNPKECVSKPGWFEGFFGLFKGSSSNHPDSHMDDDNRLPFDCEELADLKDSLAPIYDQLELHWWWGIAEYLPFKQRYQEPQVWKRNKWLGRKIPTYEEKKVMVHRSVRTRMDAIYQNGKKYKPGVVNFDEGRVDWVD